MALTNAEIQQVLDAIAALGKEVGDLPDSSELVGDELVEVSQGGVSKKADLDSFLALLGIQTATDFAPTVTDLVGGTFTVTNFLITDLGGIVEFSFAGRFDLAAATTSGSCKIDLPTAFQPTVNWASQTDVNVVLHRTNGLFTSGSFIAADDSGTKLLSIAINDTVAEDSIRFSAIGRYKRS